jgi:hypothetical protein
MRVFAVQVIAIGLAFAHVVLHGSRHLQGRFDGLREWTSGRDQAMDAGVFKALINVQSNKASIHVLHPV